MSRFAGKYANVKASGAGVVSNGEATTDVGGLHTTYQITNAAHQVLDPQATITVKKNGTAQASTLYSLDRLFGRAMFFTPLLGTDTVTMDVTYLPMTTVAGARGAELSVNQMPIDATTFASLGNTERTWGLRDANGTVDRITQMDGVFFTALEAGTPMVVEFWRNQTTVDWRAWALFTKQDFKATVTDLVGETISWESKPDANDRSVSFA